VLLSFVVQLFVVDVCLCQCFHSNVSAKAYKETEESRLLRYCRELFFSFVIFCRELNVPFLFLFQFFISLQFHVAFMIRSFLVLAFGHN